jgi:general secretion pathway protein I
MWRWIGLREPFGSRNDSKGFTLVEVLVAFTILALTLVVLLQLFGGGLRAVSASERHLMATMLARSVLAGLGAETPILAGEETDDIGDGYRWTMRIAQSLAIASIKDGSQLHVPYEVQVEISWNGRPVTTLTTLRLVTQPRPSP